jgi:cystathionine beta-lyase
MSQEFDFDTPIHRRGTHSSKWDKVPGDVLPMWVADMDFAAPPVVRQALAEVVARGVFGYPYFGHEVEEAVEDWLAKRHGWQISPESIVLLPGVVAGFNLAASAFCRPGDGLLVQTPAYGPFLKVAGHFDLQQQVHRLMPDADGHYGIDLEAFEAAITPETRVFFLCNPHNPTGRVFSRAELEGIVEICLRHEVLIVSDEIHNDLVYAGHRHIPTASLSPEAAARTITLLAPSKTFNIAGLKASAAVIENPDLRKMFNAAQRAMVDWVNLLGMTAMLAAYQHGAPWLETLLAYLEGNCDLLARFVRERLPGVRMATPEGTYLAWLDCTGLGLEPAGEDQVLNPFFQQAGVGLNDGTWFGPGGEGYVRLNFGCPRAALLEGLERMEAAITGGDLPGK